MENAESVAFIRQFIDACVRADPDEFAKLFYRRCDLVEFALASYQGT